MFNNPKSFFMSEETISLSNNSAAITAENIIQGMLEAIGNRLEALYENIANEDFPAATHRDLKLTLTLIPNKNRTEIKPRFKIKLKTPNPIACSDIDHEGDDVVFLDYDEDTGEYKGPTLENPLQIEASFENEDDAEGKTE